MPLKSLAVLLLIVPFIVTGCDEPNADFSTQDVGNAIWRNNSGLLVFAEKKDFSAIGPFEYKLYEAGADGKIGSQITDEITTDGVPPLYLSQDGNTAMTVIAENLYRHDLVAKTKTRLTTNVKKLYAVSPDLRYALLTHAELFQPIKTVSLLDISGSSPKSIREWQIKGLGANEGYWLNNGLIALSIDTGTAPFVAIYDTTGIETKSFPFAQTPARSSGYVADINTLFVKSVAGLEQINVETGARVDIVDTYINMDVKGNTLVYIVYEGEKNRVFVRNIQSGETQEVASDAFRYVILSPQADKLAYLVETRTNFTELKVISITTP